MAVNDLRESANCRTSKLQQEALTMQDSTSSVKAEWMVHMETTESNYHEDTSAVESGKQNLAEVLQICLNKAEVGSQQWRNAQESLLSLEKKNAASVDTIVRGGIEANQALRARFSSVVSTTVEDVEIANKDICTLFICNKRRLYHTMLNSRYAEEDFIIIFLSVVFISSLFEP